MTQDGEAPPSGTVTALRQPPVRQSIMVRSGRRHTFDTFVRTIGIWWPVTPFSAGQDRVRDVTFEPRQGCLGGAYRGGWARILGCLAAVAGGQS